MSFRTLRLVLGDQLNENHRWFKEVNPAVLYVMMEIRQETDYVRHHIQKVMAFFAAMRLFSRKMQQKGHTFVYLELNNAANTQTLEGNLGNLLDAYPQIVHFEYQLPDEYRLDQQLHEFCQTLSITCKAVDSEHFYTSRTELAAMFKGKKSYLMETFYRKMRQKHHVLLNEQGEPEGGQWNYDAANRKKYDGKTKIPPLPVSDTAETSALLQEIATLLQENEVDTLGDYPEGDFLWPLHREAALQLLSHFCTHLLPAFGTFQDAMQADEPFLFHSRLSFVLNAKLLSPQEAVNAAIAAWKESPERIGLAQVEGFVRQIIGWREYMRGIYWAKMPQYATLNFFEHRRALPQFYWTGRTRMRCMSQAIGQSLQWAYAHHIQRLMITGNFALLAGIAPDEVDAWYLGIYIDAIEWVEITNTRGMSQFADGGIVGTKPYVSSANYIHKMSDYCKGCYYDKDKRHGERACPFNSLYWHFYHRHRALLASNPRIGMAYVTLNKMPAEELDSTLRQAEKYLQNLDEL